MYNIYHIVNSNLKEINQINGGIELELKFYSNSKWSIFTNKYPLLVVTVRFIIGNEYRSTVVSRITYMWDRGSTNIMIKRKHTKPYERNLRSNQVEYITDAGSYFTPDYVKLTFCVP